MNGYNRNQTRFQPEIMRKILFQKLHNGILLKTPSGKEFEVERIESERLILRVGQKRWPLYFQLSCLEELANEFNRLAPNQWMLIGAVHGTPNRGSLESIVQKYTGGTSAASYLSGILEFIGVAEINRKRPQGIRLLHKHL